MTGPCRRGERMDWMYQGGLAAKEDAAKKAEVWEEEDSCDKSLELL